MSPFWKRRRKQGKDDSLRIPKTKIPKTEEEPSLPEIIVKDPGRTKTRDSLPLPREKSREKSRIPKSKLKLAAQFEKSRIDSKIPKSKQILPSKREKPRGDPGKAKTKHYLPPRRVESRQSPRKSLPSGFGSKITTKKKQKDKGKGLPAQTRKPCKSTVIPSRSGTKSSYAGREKERGRFPPIGQDSLKSQHAKPTTGGVREIGWETENIPMIRKLKKQEEKKSRQPVPQELLESAIEKEKITSKTPRKDKIPPKSKIPK